MEGISVGAMEMRFADIIWQNEPVNSGALCKLAEQELSWKKSTTYTVLKRLCERGIFQNDNGVVTSKLSKVEVQTLQSRQFVDHTFGGSLPAFLAAFSGHKKMSEEEIQKLEDLIRQSREEGEGEC